MQRSEPTTQTPPPAENKDSAGIFQPGKNVWKVATAERAAVLIDGASYFGALREAMLQADRTIHIVGWDIDTRTLLVGESGEVSDELPLPLGEFLTALVERKPWLSIRILLWDYPLLYALDREPLPAFRLGWRTPKQIDFCLDDALPIGSSHHQKIVVIDEVLAFVGGIDLTLRRWDTREHLPVAESRADPEGNHYPPFHDIQVLVSGEAARSLGELVANWWRRAACENIERPMDSANIWPQCIKPEFQHVTVGISRTEPAFAADPEIREVEALYIDLLRNAQRTIYIENQYLTSAAVFETLGHALIENKDLEVVIVCRNSYRGWLERMAMIAGRRRLTEMLERMNVADRVLLSYPRVEKDGQSTEVLVHAKVMIVDDRYLRIGSSNLCNRSMGVDSECDVVITAEDRATARQIAAIRNKLIGEHCGASPARVAQVLRESPSFISAVQRLSIEPTSAPELPDATYELVPVEDKEENAAATWASLESVVDPLSPIDPTQSLVMVESEPMRRRRYRRYIGIAGAVAGIIALAAAWSLTPLSELADPASLKDQFAGMSGPYEALIVVAVFVCAGFIAFPVVALIVATAAVFGAWPGVAYAGAGALASAIVTYAIGRWLGHKTLRRFLGPRLNRINRSLVERGILAITAIRLLPAAPYTLVNLAAGAMGIHPIDYIVGTALGLAPGLLLMSVLGHQITALISAPSLPAIIFVAVLIVIIVAVSIGMQRLASRLRRPR